MLKKKFYKGGFMRITWFHSHTKSIIKTANQKLSALFRVAPLMTDFNKKVIFNSFNCFRLY